MMVRMMKPVQTANKLSKQVELSLDYLLYLPPDYDRQESWPLLLFLHGADRRGSGVERLKAYGPPMLVENGIGLVGIRFDCTRAERMPGNVLKNRVPRQNAVVRILKPQVSMALPHNHQIAAQLDQAQKNQHRYAEGCLGVTSEAIAAQGRSGR